MVLCELSLIGLNAMCQAGRGGGGVYTQNGTTALHQYTLERWKAGWVDV